MGLLAARLSQAQPRKDETAAEVNAVLSGIVRFGHPLQVFLFGSALTEQFTWASDLDFVVLFRDQESKALGRERILLNGPYSKRSVDYLFCTEEEFQARAAVGGVYAVVKKNGRLIYDQRSAV
jgi:hypothetical protein